MNDVEYVAAYTEAEACEFFRHSMEWCEDAGCIEAREADKHKFYADGYNASRDEDCTSSMLEEAERRVASGEVPPFQVAVSLDVL
jgi:hypothetical protein